MSCITKNAKFFTTELGNSYNVRNNIFGKTFKLNKKNCAKLGAV